MCVFCFLFIFLLPVTGLAVCTFCFIPNHGKTIHFLSFCQIKNCAETNTLNFTEHVTKSPALPGFSWARDTKTATYLSHYSVAFPRQSSWPKQQSGPRTSGQHQLWFSERRKSDNGVTWWLASNCRLIGPCPRGPHLSVKTQRHRLRYKQSC